MSYDSENVKVTMATKQTEILASSPDSVSPIYLPVCSRGKRMNGTGMAISEEYDRKALYQG